MKSERGTAHKWTSGKNMRIFESFQGTNHEGTFLDLWGWVESIFGVFQIEEQEDSYSTISKDKKNWRIVKCANFLNGRKLNFSGKPKYGKVKIIDFPFLIETCSLYPEEHFIWTFKFE